MSTLKVKTYEPDMREAWDDFVRRHPEGTVYHTRAWQDVVENCFGYPAWQLVAVGDDDSISGLLPVVRLSSRLFGNFAFSSLQLLQVGLVLLQ